MLLCFSLVASTALGQPKDDRKTLVVASNMLHPPFSYWDHEKVPTGIEVDIVRAAAEELGMQVEFVERPFPSLFDAIANGEIDIAISTIGATAARRKKVDFSDPYYETQIVALVTPDTKFETLKDLQNAKIGADKSTTSFLAAQKRFPKAKIVEKVDDGSSWPKMLQDKLLDAFVVDLSDLERLQDVSGISLKPIGEPITNEQFCVALAKGNQPLLSAINRAVRVYRPTVPYRIGNQFQLTTGLGRKLYSLKNPPRKLVQDFIDAKTVYDNDKRNPDLLIWYGRRAGYLLRMNEAIEIFSEGISQFPNDARMYRHRGHRYISIRQFDRAIVDLEMAAQLIKNTPDRIEPDGVPNSENIPLTTLHGNIWYHLGLAYYLKNDLKNALRCYNQRIKLEKYGDNKVSNSHWKYMTMRRLGMHEEAAYVVKGIRSDLRVIENMSYHQMCLLYNKTFQLKDLSVSTDGSSSSDVVLYGVGNWNLYELGQKQAAKAVFENLLKNGSPYSFAFIAAEADYLRLFR